MAETFDSGYQEFIHRLFELDCNNFESDNRRKYEYIINYDQSRDNLLALVRPEDQKLAQEYLENMSYGESMEIEYHRQCMLHNAVRILKRMGAL